MGVPCWGVRRLTPDLFLPAALADGHHVLLELPTVTADKAHSSVKKNYYIKHIICADSDVHNAMMVNYMTISL